MLAYMHLYMCMTGMSTRGGLFRELPVMNSNRFCGCYLTVYFVFLSIMIAAAWNYSCTTVLPFDMDIRFNFVSQVSISQLVLQLTLI